jgi:hypothetical protein
MLAVASQTGFIYTHNVDPCLKGFTQTIPPVEEWGNYAVLDVKGGSFLYPELMFRCNGTVTRITIPYSTVHGILWDNVLELRIVIWRRQGRLGYVEGKGIIAMTPVITTASYAATTQGNRRGNTTNNSTIKIERNDILQFIVLQNGKYGRREHIPVLLRENTESCTPLGCPLVPMVHVDFTCSESSKSIEDSGATVMTPTERPKVKPSEDVATVATKILIDMPTKVRILDVTTTAKQTKLSISQISPCPSAETTDSIPFEAKLGLAVVLTQVEATVLSVVVTVLVMCCCCKTMQGKKPTAREYEVPQDVDAESEYEDTSCETFVGSDVVMQSSPAYGLPGTVRIPT